MLKRKPRLVQVDPDVDGAEVTKQFIKHFGYTVREAADQLSVDPSAISRWTTGERRPRPSMIMVMQELMRRYAAREEA